MQPYDDRNSGPGSDRTKQSDPWYNVNPTPTSNMPLSSYSSAQLPSSSELENARLYAEASKRVQKKVNFYKTLTSYIIVCSFLWVLALITGTAGVGWPIWVMLGWGIGLAFQAADAFGWGISDTQRQSMIDEEIRRMRGPRN